MNHGKIAFDLPKAMEASNYCLPHAAMNLGSVRGVGLRPTPGMVKRVVVESQMNQWVVYRLDDGGGFVGDSWHGSREDALSQVKKEFGIDISEFA